MIIGIMELILFMICIYSIKAYLKRMMRGCCMNCMQSQNQNYDCYQKKIKITGITCQSCQKRIANSFQEETDCLFQIDQNENVCWLYIKASISDNEIKQKIESLGYHVLNITNK